MAEIPASWVTLISLAFGAVTAAIAWAWKERGAELKEERERNKFLTEKVEGMLRDRIGELKALADSAEKRRETDERIAKAIDVNTSEIAALKLMVKP